jgi:hypothetical protein
LGTQLVLKVGGAGDGLRVGDEVGAVEPVADELRAVAPADWEVAPLTTELLASASGSTPVANPFNDTVASAITISTTPRMNTGGIPLLGSRPRTCCSLPG